MNVTMEMVSRFKGKEIPLHASVAVADSYGYEFQRIYRNQLPPEKIIRELKGLSLILRSLISLKLLREDRIHVKEDHLSITENTQIPEAENLTSVSTIYTKSQRNLTALGFQPEIKVSEAIARLMKHHKAEWSLTVDMDNLKNHQ